jgi:hypothetical protein
MKEAVIKLEVSFQSIHNHRMKNKNTINREVHELVNIICELQTLKGNREYMHSYALGTIQAILDWEVKGFNKGFRTLQESINNSYDIIQKELDALKMNDIQKVCNEAKLEELYA